MPLLLLRDVRAYYYDCRVLPLRGGRRFPMQNYRLLRERGADTAPAAAPQLSTGTVA